MRPILPATTRSVADGVATPLDQLGSGFSTTSSSFPS